MRYHDGLCRSEKTLGLITLAASLSMLGARDADGQLAGKGLQAYGMAVQEMTVALGDPRRSVGDGLLASARLMRLFEILFGQNSANPAQEASSPQVDGYFAHTDGEMALFMKRGRSVIDTEVSRQLYADGRLVSFILGTTRRQRSLFSRPEWTSIPWDDLAKTPHDKLLDAMIHLPGLLEDLDTISAHADPPDPQRQTLATERFLYRSRQVEQQLLRWKKNMGHQLDKFDFTKVGCDSNMPTAELDRDFALIHLSCLFWGACLLLYSAMEQAQDLLPTGPAAEETGPDDDDADADNDTTSSRQRSRSSSHEEHERSPSIHASRIAHCIGQMFQPRAGNYGAMAALFPLGITLRHLRPGAPAAAPPTAEPRARSQEWRMLKELFSRPFMGTYVGRFLSNLRRQDANPVALHGTRGGGPMERGAMGMEERARRWWNAHAESM
ncbi:hypothetical protein N3K66_007776 [Trichothecium roseum]|uniref:Uncharacterized protein n=1 Tax=Trichothecium roseum TaxID=47278 RepID=A0ACC0UUX4_9HYPO|nr:hypothetical protein N3K66_007776 [Trichothecium roseum]